MKIKFENEKMFRDDLIKLKNTVESLLQEDLSEKEFTEENYKKMKKIENEIIKLKWIRFDGAIIKIVSSDGAELT